MKLFRLLLIALVVMGFGVMLRSRDAAGQTRGSATVRIEATDVPPEDCGGPTRQASIAGKGHGAGHF